MTLRAGCDRIIDYMRISVTDRCNFRCRYCMPAEGIECKPREEILSYEDIIKVARISAEEGITSFRLTGGEPLTRKGIDSLISALADLPGCEEVTMTTNGYLLEKKAEKLAEAGLSRVNVSLDTLSREKFAKITRVDGFDEVMQGISAAEEAGLKPVKINVVVMDGINDEEIIDFVCFARDENLHVRFIEYMPFYEIGCKDCDSDESRTVSLNRVKQQINKKFTLIPQNDTAGRGPAEVFSFQGSSGLIGFISPVSGSICAGCNRFRLTADGYLRPCLAREEEINIFRDGKLFDEEEIRAALYVAAREKPERGFEKKSGAENCRRNMSQIGG